MGGSYSHGSSERAANTPVIFKANHISLDLTWDNPITDTGEQILAYDYFLKDNRDFSNHRRDSMYRTNVFNTKYPIATESYEK